MDFWLYEESAEWKGHPKQLERSGQAVKASKLWSRPYISRRWNFSQMDWLWSGGTTSYIWITSSGIDQQWRHWTFFHSRYSLLKWFGTFKLSIWELCTFHQERSFARWQQYWSSQLVGVPNWETSGGLTISFNILSDHFPPLYGIICNAPKFGKIISF